jgi:hypothetical protein
MQYIPLEPRVVHFGIQLLQDLIDDRIDFGITPIARAAHFTNLTFRYSIRNCCNSLLENVFSSTIEPEYRAVLVPAARY